jgi:hypothetical protein
MAETKIGQNKTSATLNTPYKMEQVRTELYSLSTKLYIQYIMKYCVEIQVRALSREKKSSDLNLITCMLHYRYVTNFEE